MAATPFDKRQLPKVQIACQVQVLSASLSVQRRVVHLDRWLNAMLLEFGIKNYVQEFGGHDMHHVREYERQFDQDNKAYVRQSEEAKFHALTLVFRGLDLVLEAQVPAKPEWIEYVDEKWVGNLMFRGEVARHVSEGAVNIIDVLRCFQKEGWPPAVDPKLAEDKRWSVVHQLKNTMFITFRNDGAGNVTWEIAPRLIRDLAEEDQATMASEEEDDGLPAAPMAMPPKTDVNVKRPSQAMPPTATRKPS